MIKMKTKTYNCVAAEKWLLENIYYDEEYGLFFNIKSGEFLVSKDVDGYTRVSINIPEVKATIKLHRVAWFLTYGEWPKECIDHINGIRSDNRIENLRDVSHSENSRNTKHHRKGNFVFKVPYNYINKRKEERFAIQLPNGYSPNKNRRGAFSYTCELQAEMAAHMIETGEFNPEIHNRRVVDHLNKTGNLLKRNLKWNNESIYVVTYHVKGIRKTFQSIDYKTALDFHRSIYGK